MSLPSTRGASSDGWSAAEDLEFRRWNLARRLCLAARASSRPDDAAAALACLGRILRDGAADPARRKLKSGSASFAAKLGSLGLTDVLAFLAFAGFTAAVSKDGGATMVLKLAAVDACSAAAEVLRSVELDIAAAAMVSISRASPTVEAPLPPAPPHQPQLEQPKAPPPPSAPGGGCAFFTTERIPLAAVVHIDARCFDVLAVHAMDKSPAERDVKYWGGAEEPWRDGTTDAAITDPFIIAREEVAKRSAEAEDAARCPTAEAHGAMLHGLALRADFLVSFTFTLNTWSWKTWEVQTFMLDMPVVQYLIKPATEANRCRFSDLPFVKPYTGPATIFLSHAWNGNWGDAVAAACQGARMDRFVWIDIAAVRQWPGNGADLDFRAVVRRSRALVVAAAPVPGAMSANEVSTYNEAWEFRASAAYNAASKTLAFCRLWCIVELHAGLEAGKLIIFRCCAARFHVSEGFYITISSGREAENMLLNFSKIVDVATAECAVPADKERELRTIGEGNFAALNRVVAGSMIAGSRATQLAVWEVDAFNCGEPEALQRLPRERFEAALIAAGGAGLASVSYLLDERAPELGLELLQVLLCTVMLAATQCGHAAVVERLLAEGVDVNYTSPMSGNFPLLMAAYSGNAAVVQLLLEAEGVKPNQMNFVGDFPLLFAAGNGDAAVVQRLLAFEGINVNQVDPSEGAFPLLMAATNGHAAVVQLLLAAEGIDLNLVNPSYGNFPLLQAVQQGHASVVQLLVAAGVDVNQVNPITGNASLLLAVFKGHAAVVEKLLAAKSVNVNQVDPRSETFPLMLAVQQGHTAVVKLLLTASGVRVNQVNPSDGGFALLLAMQQGNAEMVRLLLTHGANRTMTWRGKSVLEIAIEMGRAEVTGVLLS